MAELTGALDDGQDLLVEHARMRTRTPLGRSERSAALLVAGGFVVAAGLVAVAFLPSTRMPSPIIVAALVAAYVLLSRIEFETGTGYAVPTQIVFIPMLFLVPVGLLPALVATALILGALPEVFRTGRAARRLTAALASSWYAIGPCIVIGLAGEPAPTLGVWPVLVVALAAQFAFDFSGAAAWEWIGHRHHPSELLRPVRAAYTVDIALSPIGLLAAMADTVTAGASLLAVPLGMLLAMFSRERKERLDQALELSAAYRGTAMLLGDVVEADDTYTGLHSWDVVTLSLAAADELGVRQADRRLVELTALLHDVGKIRIAKEIINKPGPLTAEERAIVESHTVEGERMLKQVGGLVSDVGTIVRSCHERWDGSGYPDGLAGEHIPLVARIVPACDVFSAMRTDRPYRDALPRAVAVEELRQCAGTQFDPRVVAALVVVAGTDATPEARAA